jgi:hypothetical protein
LVQSGAIKGRMTVTSPGCRRWKPVTRGKPILKADRQNQRLF